MNEKKLKAYRYLILITVISAIVSGINYTLFKVPIVGISLVITIIGLVIIIICYKMEVNNFGKG